MPYKYCKSCGAKNQYVGSTPKFCSSCGKPMSASVATKRVVKNSIAQKKTREIIGDDETDIDYVPNIANLQYNVDPFEKKSFKIEELFSLEDDGKEEKG